MPLIQSSSVWCSGGSVHWVFEAFSLRLLPAVANNDSVRAVRLNQKWGSGLKFWAKGNFRPIILKVSHNEWHISLRNLILIIKHSNYSHFKLNRFSSKMYLFCLSVLWVLACYVSINLSVQVKHIGDWLPWNEAEVCGLYFWPIFIQLI